MRIRAELIVKHNDCDTGNTKWGTGNFNSFGQWGTGNLILLAGGVRVIIHVWGTGISNSFGDWGTGNRVMI